MTTKVIERFEQTRQQLHPGCIVCSQVNEQGLRLDFRVKEKGVVAADFIFDRLFEGYPAMLHGGVLCTILDGAMTNCLFAHDCVAVTADLRVRFRHPVLTDRAASVRAWISRSCSCLYEMKAEILQDGKIKTTATAKFMRQAHLGKVSSL